MLSRLSLVPLLSLALALGGCANLADTEQKRVSREWQALKARTDTEYAIYQSLAKSRKSQYKNKELMALASPENTRLEITLKDQRGHLYVRDLLAMEFPVASGKKTHPTPTGSYHIRAKEKDYNSNLYGKIYDAAGEVVVKDADIREDKVPEGGRFEGAPMPYWMRLTDSGVGLHVGYVPGVPASHGCIRLRQDTAATLFSLTKIGTPVVIR